MPTILAGALKRMPGLPANVVAGVPRVEKDPRGGDVVIVPVCVCSIESGPCERVDVFHVSGRFWSTS
ncbi:hypothetical protein ABG908_05935, partial [Bifidobacterium longum]|nr:hypothetical protein [Bifidobacterium longum]MDB6588902.1 hypothetical protein [Bifidobacterium longum]MDB6589811.1 hypothetical protein [Bifidobacterium longum]